MPTKLRETSTLQTWAHGLRVGEQVREGNFVHTRLRSGPDGYENRFRTTCERCGGFVCDGDPGNGTAHRYEPYWRMEAMQLHNAMCGPNSRYWSKVDKSGDCWVWTGRRTADGYGVTWFKGKQWLAHRLMAKADGRLVFYDDLVLHRCDKPPCVRPDHLFIGDNAANMQDMWNKKRHPLPKTGPHPGVQGERHPHASLTAEMVREIRRRSDEKSRIVGADLGVSAGTVRKIRRGIGWTHVT